MSDDRQPAPAPTDASGGVATPENGLPRCGARLVAWEIRDGCYQDPPGRCGWSVRPPRKSGCCDAHKVRLWDEAHPRMNRPHSRRRTNTGQAIRDQILGFMADGKWWTVWMLAERCACMETTASAKMRDLRKRAYGQFKIEGRRLPNSAAYEFKLSKVE